MPAPTISRSSTPARPSARWPVCQLVEEEGLSIDVSAGGEYHTALVAGFPTDRMFYHGNNKTPGELGYALDNGIGFVVVDSLDEMGLLEQHGRRTGSSGSASCSASPPVWKPTPTTTSRPASWIRSSDSAWLRDMQSRRSVGRWRRRIWSLVGLHAHIGSQIFELEGFRRAIAILVDLVKETHDLLRLPVPLSQRRRRAWHPLHG